MTYGYYVEHEKETDTWIVYSYDHMEKLHVQTEEFATAIAKMIQDAYDEGFDSGSNQKW